jgi:hypothetical protein
MFCARERLLRSALLLGGGSSFISSLIALTYKLSISSIATRPGYLSW